MVIIDDLKLITKVEEVRFGDELVHRWTLLLPGAGCEWAKKTGGCSMCGFIKATDQYTGGKLWPVWIFQIIYFVGYIFTLISKPTMIRIFNGGSFLNPNEIPIGFQNWLFKKISLHPTINKVFIESRVEYIYKERIEEIQNILGDKRLIIGIGLESQDENIRNNIICKGLSNSDYENTVKMLKLCGVEVLSYVFLKPIGLGEKEAILDAINTARYAFGVGSKYIALESAFIQEGTKMCSLYQKGVYQPPWLWSIVEVVKSLNNEYVVLDEFSDEPVPIALPRNCGKCDERVLAAMENYRKDGSVHIFTKINCSCREQWKEILREV